jgi:spermidine synthase
VTDTWFPERLHRNIRQAFRIKSVRHHEKTLYQDLKILDSAGLGRMLALDNVIQVTEADDFFYHEMLVHVPVFAHGRVRQVLIIGGGDGGILRETLRHKGIKRAVMVEIDRRVTDLCKAHMPRIGGSAWRDPRAEILFADGMAYVAETGARFDLIIVDSTDPTGPGEVLFKAPFYRDCRRILQPGGIVVTQNGVPFLQPWEVADTRRRLGRIFRDVAFYVVPVPTYQGGLMTLAWASDDLSHRNVSLATLKRRFARARFETGYYTPEIHVGAFALPPYIVRLMAKGRRGAKVRATT